MKLGRLLIGFLLIGGLLAIAPVAVAQDGGGGGRGAFNQEPGSGGPGGGDPCQSSQKGWCEYMTIYPDGYECTASWCEPDPSAWFKCASHNTPSCQQGTDANGEPILVMINSCAFCGI